MSRNTFTIPVKDEDQARDPANLRWKEIVVLLAHNLGQVALAIREHTARADGRRG